MIELDWQDVLGWNAEHISQARALGYLYYKQGQYDISAKFFEALLVINPHALYELRTLGAIYYKIDRLKEALMFLDRALDIDPSHLPTLMNRCRVLLALGDRIGALEIAKLLRQTGNERVAKTAEALIASSQILSGKSKL